MTTTAAPANIVGQPATATVLFKDASGALYDPPTVVLSSVSPFGNETAYTYGTDNAVTRNSLGSFTLAFVPTAAGSWAVIGDAIDALGGHLGSGMSATLEVSARLTGSMVMQQALSVVEQWIKPWTLHVITDTTRVYATEDGILELPGRPVISVASVTDVATGEPWLPLPSVYGNRLIGSDPNPSLLPNKWYDVVYTHGWSDATIPAIVATVVQRVAARLGANPNGVTREAIGPGYSVDYGNAASLDLLPDEKKALAQYRANRASTLITTDLTGNETGP